MTISNCLKGVIIAAAFMAAPLAIAGPSATSHEMKTAFAKAAQGPQQLRWYVQRTKPIYMLDYNEVMDQFEASKVASTDQTVQVAQAARQ